MNKELANRNSFKVIGVMSGTSLDGLDIAAVEIHFNEGKWSFNLVEADTISYPKDWEKRLKTAPQLSGEELTELHSKYGYFTGEQVKNFLVKTNFAPDLIASHGHTVFHRPDKGYTLQIGNGAAISAVTKHLTVSDFRTGDVAHGGQGAPLVPIGDKLLFSDFDYCLNLGGFANISYEKGDKRLAYDNCPVNFVLNFFAEKKGLPYDNDGELGRQGEINTELLQKLNNISFYKNTPPKSLGREWVENFFLPVLNEFNISDTDKLRTIYEHIAVQITNAVSNSGKMLVTGGGAFNSFLIERIKELSHVETIIPAKEIIDFKEAIIFAFLGVLRVKNINNCLASVTGATKDSCGGIIHILN